VLINVGDPATTFEVHKSILTQHSEFFRAALDGNFREAKEKAIDLKEDVPEIFRILIVWLYTRKLAESMTKGTGGSASNEAVGSNTAATTTTTTEGNGVVKRKRKLHTIAFDNEGFACTCREPGTLHRSELIALYMLADRLLVSDLKEVLFRRWIVFAECNCLVASVVVECWSLLPELDPMRELILDWWCRDMLLARNARSTVEHRAEQVEGFPEEFIRLGLKKLLRDVDKKIGSTAPYVTDPCRYHDCGKGGKEKCNRALSLRRRNGVS
jgi:hypothetical protein